MLENDQLLNLKEVSALLKINAEVLRRWLRAGKLAGIKVGSDWRVKYSDLEPFFNSTNDNAKVIKHKNLNSLKKMSTACPKWLEYSGLPRLLNDNYGPEAWPIFKKLIEFDFEANRPANRQIVLNIEQLSEVTGYDTDFVENILRELSEAGYIKINNNGINKVLSIVSPIKTPKLVLDIDYKNGGISGAPAPALNNPCLRRYLESK